MMYTLLILFLVGIHLVASSELSCKDQNNNDVDWFIIQKLPRMYSNRTELHYDDRLSEGTAFIYMDSNNPSWTDGKLNISDDKNPVGLTMESLFGRSKDIAYVLFNDEHPNGNWTLKYGHTKGLVGADSKRGFYIVHSVPKFPAKVQDGYLYPHSGRKYGQDFLCVSIKSDQVNNIGLQIIYNQPWVYDYMMPEPLKKLYPNLFKAMKEETPGDDHRITTIESAAGTTFTSFAKSGKFGDDLYSGLVIDKLNTSIATETWWIHYKLRLGPYCDGDYQVVNIEKLNYDVVHINFSNYNDHSKFVVSTNQDEPWICLGDINRSKSQFVRGGGTVCMKNDSAWKAYHRNIVKTDGCYGAHHKSKSSSNHNHINSLTRLYYLIMITTYVTFSFVNVGCHL